MDLATPPPHRHSVSRSDGSPPPAPPRRAADGGRLEEALARFGGLLEHAVRRRCPSDLGIDPQDVLQDARLRLWRFLERAAGHQLTPSYVHKVAASAAIDALRGALARREVPLAPAPRGDEPAGHWHGEPTADRRWCPEQRARRRQLAGRIEAALIQLPAARRRAVRGHLLGLSSSELAQLTGWSRTKVRSLVSRGLHELRQRLAEQGIGSVEPG